SSCTVLSVDIIFLFSCVLFRLLPSFPTRRSSDLAGAPGRPRTRCGHGEGAARPPLRVPAEFQSPQRRAAVGVGVGAGLLPPGADPLGKGVRQGEGRGAVDGGCDVQGAGGTPARRCAGPKQKPAEGGDGHSGQRRYENAPISAKTPYIPSVLRFSRYGAPRTDTIVGHGGTAGVVEREGVAACPDRGRSLFRVVRPSLSPCAARSTSPTPPSCARRCSTPPTGPSATAWSSTCPGWSSWTSAVCGRCTSASAS